MTLQVPSLDDRTFQDIVDECKRRIPQYAPDWTDHNVSDPGVTLIELFAWMTEILLYRMNQVPRRNYIKFLEMIGVHVEPPRPARAEVMFRLTTPQPAAVVIPAGTEVATQRTVTSEEIIFATEKDLEIQVPLRADALTSRMVDGKDGGRHEYTPALNEPDKYEEFIFQRPLPKPGDAFYVGYHGNLAGHMLRLNIKCKLEAIGIETNNAPLAWQYWHGNLKDWQTLSVEDTTWGLNRDGELAVHIPLASEPTILSLETQSLGASVSGLRTWIRCQVTKARANQPEYKSAPRILSLETQSLGASVSAVHSEVISRETLGRSDGAPGQTFTLSTTPLLPRREWVTTLAALDEKTLNMLGEEVLKELAHQRLVTLPEEIIDKLASKGLETLVVQTETPDLFEIWHEVPDFGATAKDAPHFTCDSVTGQVALGPSIRLPNREEEQHGRVPKQGRSLRFTRYRTGGGVVGNVGKGTLTQLKTSIPYVALVTNPEPASGGAEAESLEGALLRGPQVVRSNPRAVTDDDFERLAREVPGVARARCSYTRGPEDGPAGTINLVLVPQISTTDAPVPPEQLIPTQRLHEAVKEYLRPRQIIGIQLKTEGPKYQPISVHVDVHAKPHTDHDELRRAVEKELYRFIHPTVGGPEGTGWPFEPDDDRPSDGPGSVLDRRRVRPLFMADIYGLLQKVPNIESVGKVELYANGSKLPDVLTVPPSTLLCSEKHKVDVKRRQSRSA